MENTNFCKQFEKVNEHIISDPELKDWWNSLSLQDKAKFKVLCKDVAISILQQNELEPITPDHPTYIFSWLNTAID